MNTALAQKTTIDNYYNTLKETGYLKEASTEQVLFATLLLDTLTQFEEFVTDEFTTDVNRILTKLNCCNCLVAWDGECSCSNSTPDKKYDFAVKQLPAYYSGNKVQVCCALQGDDDFYVAGDSYNLLWDMPKPLNIGNVLRVVKENTPIETSWGLDNLCVASHAEQAYIETDTGGEELYDDDAVIGLSQSIIFQKGKLYRITAFIPYINNEDFGAILYEEVE